jgi:23S rRNA pseudouridine1911/1915/1917 synthase
MYSSGREGDGQEAVTTYTVLREGKGYSLVDVRIETGRKNQIRVHMSELGHPIVGDRQYGSGANPIGRLALHAGLLALTHPFTGKALVFESRTPDSFLSLLKD